MSTPLATRRLSPVAVVLALSAPATALGDDDREVRVRGACGAGARSELRLEQDGAAIRVRFELRSARAGERWRIVLVHERRVVWRGGAKTRSGGSLRVRRSLADLAGADQVTARASGPRGNTCIATGVLPGS